MGNPLIQGLMMGGAIFMTDLLLRPNLAASGMMEILLFFAEGAICDLVYDAMSGCGSGGKMFGIGNLSLKKSALGGLTIWLSDFFLRPQVVTGAFSEIVKFLIQGMLVMLVFNYTPGTD